MDEKLKKYIVVDILRVIYNIVYQTERNTVNNEVHLKIGWIVWEVYWGYLSDRRVCKTFFLIYKKKRDIHGVSLL